MIEGVAFGETIFHEVEDWKSFVIFNLMPNEALQWTVARVEYIANPAFGWAMFSPRWPQAAKRNAH